MKVVTVIPLVPGSYKEDLTYFTAHDVGAGMIVSVPIRKKIVDAVVVGVEHLTSSKIAVKASAFALKKIHSVKGPLPFYKEFWNAVVDAKTYFLGTTGATLYAIVPKIFFDEHASLPALSPRVIEKDPRVMQEKLALQRPLNERIALYKTLIRELFAKKQSLYICLPTVRDAAFFYDELKKGVEEHIYLFHSDITAKETLKRYGAALANKHAIVIVGTASYLCIPRHDINTIIVERETSSAYRQISRPYVDMRVFAEMFSRRIGAKLIFADTFLRTETIYRTQMGELSEMSHPSYHLSKTIDRQIIDSRRGMDIRGDTHSASSGQAKKFQMISDALQAALEETLHANNRAFLFTLRKGLAPITQCGDCETVLICDHCQSPLVLYKETTEKRIYSCNKCEKKFPSLMLCPVCASWKLVTLGIGTETVADEITKLFPKANVIIVDKEHTKTPKQVEKAVKTFYETPGSILIGTELALPFLRTKIPTVGIVSFDSLFSVPSFRIGEKIISLVARLEEITEKKFLIQTKNIDESLIRDIGIGNLAESYKSEIEIRQSLGFPPFSTFIKLALESKQSEAGAVKEMAEALFAGTDAEFFPPVAHRNKSGITTHIIVRVKKDSWSPQVVMKKPDATHAFAARFASLGYGWSICVDPEDLA